MKTSLVAVLLTTLTPAAHADDIADRLATVPGLTVVSEAPVQDHRVFTLDYTQPVDHRDATRGTFRQRVQLWHRATNRPTVIHTNGYEVPSPPTLFEPAQLLDANQVVVGQRYFTDSRPATPDWSTLSIWQAATDHHRLTTALKHVYPSRWLASGVAKGGAAAVYHRRFYPQDVSGVIAYGAPNNVNDNDDTAYNRFLETVGTPACRDALSALQTTLLDRRTTLQPRYETWAAANGLTFNQVIGSVDRAFELMVVHTPYAFWQFYLEADCPRIPAPTASNDDLWAFLDEIVSWRTPADQTLTSRTAWFHQAVREIGFPSIRPAHLAGRLHHPDIHEAANLLEPSLRPAHDPRSMPDIDNWVRTKSHAMLFVNGANDPGPAEHFEPSRHDSYAYDVPGASYRTARIANLPAAQRDAAIDTMRRWAR